MTLNQLHPGQTAILKDLPSGIVGVQAIRLGLMPGTEITCVYRLNRGPVIIRKNFQQIAVGEALANQIIVTAEEKGGKGDGEGPSRWS